MLAWSGTQWLDKSRIVIGKIVDCISRLVNRIWSIRTRNWASLIGHLPSRSPVNITQVISILLTPSTYTTFSLFTSVANNSTFNIRAHVVSVTDRGSSFLILVSRTSRAILAGNISLRITSLLGQQIPTSLTKIGQRNVELLSTPRGVREFLALNNFSLVTSLCSCCIGRNVFRKYIKFLGIH